MGLSRAFHRLGLVLLDICAVLFLETCCSVWDGGSLVRLYICLGSLFNLCIILNIIYLTYGLSQSPSQGAHKELQDIDENTDVSI
jgi:hypothetical protein